MIYYSRLFVSFFMKLKTIRTLKRLTGKRVLLRVDYNVPLQKGKIADDFKIQQSLPTLQFLREQGAQVIVVTHLGRPRNVDEKLSTAPLARRLEKLLGEKVSFVPYVKDRRKYSVSSLPETPVILFENIRFYAEEEKNSATFARWLAGLADYFVFDGFAVAHRSAASVTGISKFIPCYAGLLVEQEVKYLGGLHENPKRPVVLVLGGAKVETKIPVLKALLPKADYILVAGGIANTYLAAKGFSLGSSLVGKEYISLIARYCKNAKVVLPVDYVVGDLSGKKTYTITPDAIQLSKNEGIYDIGPATVQLFARYIKDAQTIVWNGALGKYEITAYGYGTKALACLIAARSKGMAVGIVGGGETVDVIERLGLRSSIDWVSTGGGAMLDFLSKPVLPGIKQCLHT